MRLSEELEEAVRTYFYIRTRADKTIGGPYPTFEKMVAGVQRAIEKRGFDRNDLVPMKLIGGTFHELSVDEKEAVLAGLE